jgi:hypothetical protein
LSRRLADDGEGAGAVEGDLAAAQEQSQRDGQVEPAGVFLQVGRSQFPLRKDLTTFFHT